ncbi:hypothetical protein F4814DRAFT_445281 [Daldinia grandis]|nr:hypothetical protein F4814DRAFT_445281 [Daldinia grandis]
MDGKGSQKRDGRRNRYQGSGSWRKAPDSSQQGRNQGCQQDNQQSNQQAPRQGNQQAPQQDRQQDRQQDYHPDCQPFPLLIRQPIQQPAYQPAQQSTQHLSHGFNHELRHDPSHELSFEPSNQNLTNSNHAVARNLVEEVNALRQTIEFVGQRNVETLAQLETLEREFASLMQKYRRLEDSFKQSVANIPGGDQILRSMEANEQRKQRATSNSVAIPTQSRGEIPPGEKPYIDSIIDFCYELLYHQVSVTNELHEKLNLATRENADLLAYLQSLNIGSRPRPRNEASQ